MPPDSGELSCRDLVELVTEYLEGALEPAARRRFEAHLVECEGCRAYLEQIRVTVRLAGRLPEEALAGQMRQRLLAVLRNWNR